LPQAKPPTWRTRVSLFVWVITLDLSGMEQIRSRDGIAVRDCHMEMADWTLCFSHAAGHIWLRYNSLFVSLKTCHLLFPLVIKYAACRDVSPESGDCVVLF
jgi:hypothetical protein